MKAISPIGLGRLKSTVLYLSVQPALLALVILAGCAKNNLISQGANPTMSRAAITAQSMLSPINLGTANDFTILTKTGISTTGTTSVTGDIGTSPIAATAITGFGLIMNTDHQSSHSSLVTGNVFAANYAAPTPTKMTTAIGDMGTAFTVANGIKSSSLITEIYAGDISGHIILPGLYKWSTGVLVTGAGVTLSGGPNDIFIFQIAQNLTIRNNAIITLSGGVQPKNIFWVVSGQATLGTTVQFSGIILSKTLISMNTGATVTGKLLAQTAVTLIANSVHP